MAFEASLNKVVYYNPFSLDAAEFDFFIKIGTTTIEFDIFCSRLSNYRLDRDTDAGMHVLHTAVYQQNPTLVKHIIENGGKVFINSGIYQGMTPLKMAISTQNFVVTELLLDQGADVNGRGDEGMFEVEDDMPYLITPSYDNDPPLYHAAEVVKNLGLVKLLLRYQARTDSPWSDSALKLIQQGKNELESEKRALTTKLVEALYILPDLIRLITDYFVCYFNDQDHEMRS